MANYGYAGLTQVLPVVSRQSHDPAILSTGVASQISAVKAAGAEVIVSSSIPAATALDNGLITDSFEAASGETSRPWVPLAISIHSAYDANEPIGSFRMSGFGTAMLTCDGFEGAGRNRARQGIVSAIEEGGNPFAGPWLAPLGSAATTTTPPAASRHAPKADQLILPGPILSATDTTPVTICTSTWSAVPSDF